MTFTLAQLKLADELAYPDDMKKLFEKYSPDLWPIHYNDWLLHHERSITRMIFHHSRADYDRGLGKMFERILADLLGIEGP